MQRFFVEPHQIDGDRHEIYITGSDVNHIVNVLRMKKGEELWISDKEKEYHCVIENAGEDEVLLHILYVQEPDYELKNRIYLFQGLPKADKMELIVQKAVELGVTMIINPEFAAAQEISRLLRFPSAIKIDTFARGRVELLKFKVLPEFKLDGMSVSQISDAFRSDILVCAIESRDNVSIPGGDHIIHDGDMVSILASPLNAAAFFRKIGLKTNQVKNCIIVGGGTISYYLAHALLDMKIDVKIIEQNKNRCEHLSELLPDATIINGDGTNRSLLLEEGLSESESFVTLTNLDEENVFLALFAKSISDAKLVAKVNRLEFDDVIDSLDIGSVIYPKNITADYILQYVRATQNSIGSNVETLYHILDGNAEALEFAIREESAVTYIPLAELNLRKNLLVGCLNRNGRIRIPRGQDMIQVGDTVIIVTTHKGLRDITDILEK